MTGPKTISLAMLVSGSVALAPLLSGCQSPAGVRDAHALTDSGSAPRATIELAIDGAPSRGRADAKLTMVEFSDFQCPFCGRFTRETRGQLEREYVDTGKVRMVFRNFPLQNIHPNAIKAAEAAECAQRQSKFWEMHARLFANQQALADADLVRDAQAIGVDVPSFRQCFAGEAVTRIRMDLNEGARAGVTGTPTFFIGKPVKDGTIHVVQEIVGAQPYAAFKSALDAALAGS